MEAITYSEYYEKMISNQEMIIQLLGFLICLIIFILSCYLAKKLWNFLLGGI